ncbi:MAG: double-strand break repair helicase AddA, partial [Alphaproteobacteria bacterium]
LGEWAWADDAALDEHLLKLQGNLPSASQRRIARTLFARALETPGGLRVQTIHAFCERLLHQFPIEANVPGHFEILEGNAQQAMMTAARDTVLRRAETDEVLAKALHYMAGHVADDTFFAVLRDMLRKREDLTEWKHRVGQPGVPASLSELFDDLNGAFGLRQGDSEETVAARFFANTPLALLDADGTQLLQLLEANPGKTNDQFAASIRGYRLEPSAAARANAVLDCYLTKARTPKAANRAITKAVTGQIADFEDRFAADAQLVMVLADDLKSVRTIAATSALLTIAEGVLDTYETIKKTAGALDFDDLVFRTRALLSRSAMRDWVLYKLDAGISHILVDEAQDTNPAQWDIIQALAGDFFTGESARNGERTIFAVGDDKQSIFSFQGAVPARLADMRDAFQKDVEAGGARFVETPLALSFRSAGQILEAVDVVFRGDLESRVTRLGYEAHSAYHMEKTGDVIVWDRVQRRKDDAPESWTDPYDAPSIADVTLASRIVDEIEALLAGTETHPASVPARAGEILILTRKRDALFRAVNSALKARGIASVGADRIAVAEHIIVLDLLALVDFICLPDDDLQLAACLKSPLFGLTDDDLLGFAPQREGASLWNALKGWDSETGRQTVAKLNRWRERAGQSTPFVFFASLLAVDGGYKAFQSRFGGEADDVLDMFMSELQSFEERHPPTLRGFTAHLRAGAGDIKREQEGEASGVRVMTVHGAKGLEADTVFLVDTGGGITSANNRDSVLALAAMPTDFGQIDAPPLIWRQQAGDATRQQKNADEIADNAAEAEYARLLYVAMTRARHRLYVCGIKAERTPDECWYRLVERALVPEEFARDEDGEISEPFQWPPQEQQKPVAFDNNKVQASGAEPAVFDAAGGVLAIVAIPDWAKVSAPSPHPVPAPLRPSRALAEPDPPTIGERVEASQQGGEIDRAIAMSPSRRGTLIHALLQRLPVVEPSARERVATTYLEEMSDGDTGKIAELVSEALRVIDDPDLSRF